MATFIPSYDYFTKDFKNFSNPYYVQPDLYSYTAPVQFASDAPRMDTSYDMDVVNAMSNYISSQNPDPIMSAEPEPERSTLDRIFDGLSVFNYTLAGGFNNIIDDNKQTTFWGGVGEGLKASNPFGDGNEKGETTWSDVLDTAGWQPESTLGKFARGAVGFGLDVVLDPTTYLTGGTSALIRGTGRKMVGQADGVLEMTEQLARNIVEKQAKERGFKLSPEELTRDSENLAREVNRLRGIRDVGDVTPITIGLGNLPFGKKVFGNTFGKTFEIGTGDTLRKIGDASFAPVYSRIRDAIYGSRIGEMFSTKSPLYKYAKNDPAKLYDFLKFSEYTQGLHADKLKSEQLIRAKAENMGLTPSESKEVLRLMEDKTIWGKVKATVRLADTVEAQQFHKVLEDKRTKAQQELDSLNTSRDMLEKLKFASDNSLAEIEDELATLRNEYREQLKALDLNSLSDDKLEEAIQQMQGELDSLDVKDLADVDARTSDSVMKFFKEFQDQQGAYNKHREDVSKIYEMTKSDKLEPSEEFLKKYEKEFGGLSDVETVQDAYRQALTKEFQTMRDNAPNRDAKFKVLDALSEYIYGQPGRLGKTLQDGNINELVSRVKRGASPSDLEEFISANASAYNPFKNDVFRQVAKMMGYTTWEKEFDEPMKELADVMKKDGALSPYHQRIKAQLDQRNLERKQLLNFFNKMNEDEFYDWRKNYEDQQLMDDVMNIQHRLDPSERAGTYDEFDGRVMVEDGQDDFMFDDFPSYTDKGLKFNDSDFAERRKRFADADSANPNRSINEFKDNSTYSRKFTPQERAEFKLDFLQNMMFKNEKTNQSLTFKGDFNKDTMKYDFSTVDGIESETFSDLKQLNADQIRLANSVADEVQPLLDEFFDRDYGSLTPNQQKYLQDLAMQRHIEKVKGEDLKPSMTPEQRQKIVEEIKLRNEHARIEEVDNRISYDSKVRFKKDGEPWIGYVEQIERDADGFPVYKVKTNDGNVVDVRSSDVQKVYQETRNLSGDELIKRSPVAQQELQQREKLTQKLEELKAQRGERGKREKDLLDHYKTKASLLKRDVEDLEERRANFEDALASDDFKKADELEERIYRMDDILSNQEAFEKYMVQKIGQRESTRLTDKAGYEQSTSIVLDDLPLSQKVKRITKVLRAEFDKIADSEIKIGQLDAGQFNAMMGKYLPHILTEHGERLFKGKKLEKYGKLLTKDLGYGTKWNPHKKERTIKKLKMPDGRWVKNPTVEEINEYFKPILQGKNAFSEEIADIYLARALKHEELMYDDQYMKTMMYRFGKDLKPGSDLEDGYHAVMNIGELRRLVNTAVSSRVKANMKHRSKLLLDAGEPVVPLADDAVHDMSSRIRKEFLEEIGMDEAVLSDLAVPMVELSKEQIPLVQKYFPQQIRQVNDGIVNKANGARKLQIARDKSRFLKMYDKFLHFMKLNQTTVMPAFHMRNKLSNMYLNWLAVGSDSVNPALQKGAFKAVHYKGDPTQIKDRVNIPIGNGAVKSMSWSQLYELAKAHHVIDEGFFAKDIGAGDAGKGFIGSKFDPTNTEDFVLYRLGGSVGNKIENTDRLVHFVAQMKRGKSPEEAGRLSREFLFDYSDLTAFEQHVMKRLMPYYTWLRKNSRLQVTQLIDAPGKFRDVAKVEHAIESGNDENMETRYLSDFAKDWVQLPFTDSEERAPGWMIDKPVLLSPNLPFLDIGRIPDPTQPEDSTREILSQLAPQLKVPMEQAFNTNFFFNNDLVREGDNEVATRLDHIGKQFALYTALQGVADKEGSDKVRHILANLTGVKTLAYDYEGSKYYAKQDAIQRAIEEEQQRIANIFE